MHSPSIENTFFTIIIPTRERPDTLVHAIASALAQSYTDFEVLVSDNASNDQTRKVVESFADPRLKYINTGHRVSMSKNWEFALDHVSSGWVTFLGDDDAILPGALDRVNQIIKKTGTSAISSVVSYYSWPNLLGSSYGSLAINLGRGYEIRRSDVYLQKVLNGALHYFELPVLYQGGFVSYSLIAAAKEKSKIFYLSMNPDIYSAIVFSLMTETYVYSYEPLAIAGHSIHSGGTAFLEKEQMVRSYDPAQKFFNENDIPLHPNIPLARNGRMLPFISVVVYEAYLQAVKFHDPNKVRTSHAEQLSLAINRSRPDQIDIRDWACDFSLLHGLSMPREPSKESLFLKRLASYPRRLIRIFTGFSFRIVGTRRMPMRNVYEASIVAGVLKVYPPSLPRRIFSRLFKRCSKAGCQ